MLERTLESPLDCKEIKPVHPKGNQPWLFIGSTHAEAEAPVFWPPDAKSQFIGKAPDARKDWGQKQKRVAEDEMVGWHHQLNGHEFEHRKAWHAAVHGITRSRTWPRGQTTTHSWGQRFGKWQAGVRACYRRWASEQRLIPGRAPTAGWTVTVTGKEAWDEGGHLDGPNPRWLLKDARLGNESWPNTLMPVEDVNFVSVKLSWFSARKRKHDYKLSEYSFTLEKKSWQTTNFEKLIYNT